MKQLLALILAILCSTSIALADTYTGTTGDCTYTLDTDEGTLVISGSGAMKDYSYYSSVPWYSYRSYVKTITIEDGVTSIGDYAFYNCTSLTSVTIGSGLTSIGDGAFDLCWSLTSVTIPDGVTSIGDYAFYECSSLTSITIPDAVTSIGSEAFAWCTSLTSVTIGSGVTSIGDGAFDLCWSLTSVTSLATTPPSCGSNTFYSAAWATLTAASNLYQYTEYWKDFYAIEYTDDAQTVSTTIIGQCGDNLIYTLDLENGTVVIEGSGDMYDYSSSSYAPWNIYASSITSVTISDEATSIGNYAFGSCSSLTSVTIGSGVTSIGNYAFDDCSSLTSITIPDGVTSIGKYAFNSCTSLTSITIPDAVTSIGNYAFYNCSSLTSVTSLATTPPTCSSSPFSSSTYSSATLTAASNLYQYAEYWKDFYAIEYTDDAQTVSTTIIGQCGDNLIYTLDLENGTVVIEGSGDMYNYSSSSYAPWYTYASSITSVTISDEATSIGNYAFYYCTSLTSVTIGSGVTYIGDYAFYKCSSLTSVTIGSGVTSIGKYAFYECTSLTSINIPDDVTSIGSHAFYDCTSLTSINIPDGVTSIGSYAFYYCTSLTSITIPDGVTSIDSQTFYNCSSLTSTIIPDAVTYIGSEAFYYCTSLTSIIIPDAVTYIDYQAFYNCYNLTSVTIGSGVTYICHDAFKNCYNLTSVTSLGTTPPECLGDAFSSVTYICATLYAASTDYATAYYWSNFYNIVYIAGGSCGDNLKWYYSEGELIIFGSGDMYDYSSADEVPWAEFASEVTTIVVSSGVTSISDYAFYDCTSVTTVTSYDTTPPTVSENTFNSSTYSSAILNVTSTSYVLADYWKQFSTKTIVDASEEEDYSVYDIFNDDSDEDNTEVSIVTASTSAVRAIGNTIVITTETAQTAQVYSLNGQLIVKQAVAVGETSIDLSTGGVYVVVLDDGTKAKVSVK